MQKTAPTDISIFWERPLWRCSKSSLLRQCSKLQTKGRHHTFSTKKQEIPLGPGSPVRAITKYTSLTPPPLMKACTIQTQMIFSENVEKRHQIINDEKRSKRITPQLQGQEPWLPTPLPTVINPTPYNSLIRQKKQCVGSDLTVKWTDLLSVEYVISASLLSTCCRLHHDHKALESL